MRNAAYDVLIVGGGSAGAVLASRLSEDAGCKVLLLEAGGPNRGVLTKMPMALGMALNRRRYNWMYQTEAEPYLGGRLLDCPRGRGLGGSSAVNGMVYLRGQPNDFEAWREAAGDGWSWEVVSRYFRKAESYSDPTVQEMGRSGPLNVSSPAPLDILSETFLAAGAQAGHHVHKTFNSGPSIGVGRFDATVHQGNRASTARAYLTAEVRRRPNLTIRVNAHVDRIELEGSRATAVVLRGGERIGAAEIVLSAGAINSPKLLMLSGIGPADHLRSVGVELRHHLPQVGRNLQDHVDAYVQHACTKPVSLYSASRPLGMLRAGMEWMLFKTGVCASNNWTVGAFLRSDDGDKVPQIEMEFFPMVASFDGTDRFEAHGFQVAIGPSHSAARGHIHLRSADPEAAPKLHFNYMSAPEDWRVLCNGMRLAREIFAQPAFDEFRGIELSPGPDVQTDGDFSKALLGKINSVYHPCGTCRMTNDGSGVVDERLRVEGLDGLRVVDASIFPRITSANINAPTIMVAERAADLIKPDHDGAHVTTARTSHEVPA